MKILVMAAGAVGGYYGSLLARAGNDVLFVARGENLEAIRRDGLRVESVTSGRFTVRGNAAERLDGSWQADFVLFCVKSYQNAQAIETIRPAIYDGSAILTLQNGIGSGAELSDAFGPDKALVGAAYVDAGRPEPGVFEEQGGVCRIVFAEQDGRPSERASEIQRTLQAAGIESEVAEDINETLWSKLVYICALSGMTCVTRSSFKEVMETPRTAEAALRVMEEAAAVGKASGVNLADDAVDTTMARLMADKDSLVSSMHADLEAGRPLELANLNGKVSELGRELGVATPVNDMITAFLTPAHNRATSGG